MSPPPRSVSGKGFTLLELLVVLVIVGLLAGVVAPRLMGALTGMNLKTEAKKVAASLRYARSRAASEKKTFRVIFSLEENALAVVHLEEEAAGEDPLSPMTEEETDPEAGESEEEEKSEKSEKPRVYNLTEGVTLVRTEEIEELIDEEQYHIDFYPAGNSSGGEVTLGDDRESRYTLTVDFITGSVHME